MSLQNFKRQGLRQVYLNTHHVCSSWNDVETIVSQIQVEFGGKQILAKPSLIKRGFKSCRQATELH